MTSRQITKKLADAGIDMTNIKATRDEVEIFVEDDRDATEMLVAEIQAILPWGGFMTGFGAWVLRSGYVVSELEGLASPTNY